MEDADPMELLGRASEWNTFVLTQPGRNYSNFNVDEEDWDNVSDVSDLFVVFGPWAEDFLEEQYKQGEDDEFETWRLGVGIGVGIGVPIFMAGSFLVGCLFGKRRGQRTGAKEVKSSVSE